MVEGRQPVVSKEFQSRKENKKTGSSSEIGGGKN